MPDSMNVEQLMNELHEQGILNLDTPVRSLLKPQGIGMVDPVNPAADNVIAWSDYVVVTKGKLIELNEIARLRDSLRDSIRQPGSIQQ